MLRILWLAPNFNHYKARFLNHLANEDQIDLTILSGTGREKMGDQEIEDDWAFNHIRLNVNKKKFGASKEVRTELKNQFENFDWILIPAEKKNILLFLYAIKLRRITKKTKLFSYNHPILQSGNGKVTFLDDLITRFYYTYLNCVIFYTEKSCEKMVEKGFIKKKKAFWANNTIDTTQVKKHYTFVSPPLEISSFLFIGRLIPSKQVSDLIKYFNALGQILPALKLEIIGDGPDKRIVEEAIAENDNITWHGAIVDEELIAPIMTRNSLVFIPGLSGLSINHAFAYGRPYITLIAHKHGPEISYIIHGENGFILDGNFEENINSIKDLLTNRQILEQFCNNAKQKGDYLSVGKWVEQMTKNLQHG